MARLLIKNPELKKYRVFPKPEAAQESEQVKESSPESKQNTEIISKIFRS